jgi:hypothetical protein
MNKELLSTFAINCVQRLTAPAAMLIWFRHLPEIRWDSSQSPCTASSSCCFCVAAFAWRRTLDASIIAKDNNNINSSSNNSG